MMEKTIERVSSVCTELMQRGRSCFPLLDAFQSGAEWHLLWLMAQAW